MLLKKIAFMFLGLLFLGWLAGCQNNTLSTVTVKDTAVEKIPIVNKFEKKAFSYDSTKNYIYLTFDDGPQNGTVACLELCKQMGVKASFFMVGQHANSTKTKEIVAQIRESYPQILLCNHSTTHANGHYKYFYHHPNMAAEDFYKAQQSLNVPYKIIRLPGNSAWVISKGIKASPLVDSVCIILDSAKYNVIGWDVEWSFNHKNANPVQSPQRLTNMVDTAFAKEHLHTKNHLVILTHDRMFRSPNYTDSLAKFIMLLKQNSKNVFETVDHYPGVM